MAIIEPGRIILDGQGLTADLLDKVTAGGWTFALDDRSVELMAQSRALVQSAIDNAIPVYGVTTGLGARSTEVLDAETLADFSLQTVRGRAHAIGPPCPDQVVRAAMVVRLNTLLLGYSGARPEVAKHLCAVLNAGLVPVVGGIGSIGGGDLVLNATIARALVGEGRMRGPDGIGPSADVLRAAGIDPLTLAPRDGLALANHTGFCAGQAALALSRVGRIYHMSQGAAALSMEGFRANLTPLDARALAVKPLPGQQKAAKGLADWLKDSALWQKASARRLQDPLSFRNAVQIHGGVETALTHARQVLEIELNGSSDNPVALIETGEMISCGAYHSTELSLAVEAVSRAWHHLSMGQVARIARLMEPKMTDLPLFLAEPGSGSNGFAPVLKLVEDLAGEIAQAAGPVHVWPSINAVGVEDALTGVMSAIRGLERIADMAGRLTAIELIVAAQAVDLRAENVRLGPPLTGLKDTVRGVCVPLGADRPLGEEIEALAARIAGNV